MKDNKTDEKTYVVYCHTTPDGMQYYGASKNAKRRWFPSAYKRNNTPFKDAIERFGWKNIIHEVIATDLTRDEALKLEDQLIVTARNNGTCLNMLRSGHYTSTDEFRDERKSYHKVHDKAYREANPDYKKNYLKAYYEANKDRINARARERYKRKKGNGDNK